MSQARWRAAGLGLLVIAAGLISLYGCAAARAAAPQPGMVDSAAAEATAIIQRAEATALMLQAQAQATRLIQNANVSTPTPVVTLQAAPASSTPIPPAFQPASSATQPPSPSEEEEEAEDESAVQLVGVSLGTESGVILVQFKAPPTVARNWQSPNVYVVDEATGVIYNEVPVAPVVGPLFARPNHAGQTGYVMFVNTEASLRSGAQVTVVLGKFKQEHVTIP